jgi:hypothetical protein
MIAAAPPIKEMPTRRTAAGIFSLFFVMFGHADKFVMFFARENLENPWPMTHPKSNSIVTFGDLS